MALLGRIQNLVILYQSDHGFVLDGGSMGEVLLPNRECPPEVEPGDEVRVFLSRDSEDRLVATSRLPLCEAGDFAGLRVVEVHPRVGAFLDWGLAKDLLLPYAEQSKPVRTGEKVLVRVIVDPKSQRLIATSKLGRYLDKTPPRYQKGQAVSLMMIEPVALGWSAIVEGKHRGLLHSSDVPRPLEVGETLPGYIKAVKEDYKIDLSLEAVGYGRVTDLSERLLEALRQNQGTLPLGDESSPEQIREHFGASKKAFKQAVGALYRQGLVQPSPHHLTLLAPSRPQRHS